MKKISLQLLSLVFAVTVLHSCKSNPPAAVAPNEFANGVFITEQGAFQTGTGTVSFLNTTTNTITNNVFGTKNGFALGNILQSMQVINDVGYLVVNNANNIVTVNAKDMKYKATINGTTLPRYIKQINTNKAYVSEWGDSAADGAIRVLDLTTNKFTKRIIVGKGAEQILVYGSRAYVTCNGGFSNSDSIAIINIDYDTLIGKLAVGANPESIVQDADNNIWILCKGAYNSSFTALAKPASLVRYNTFTNLIDRNLPMPSFAVQASSLCINPAKTKLYYLYENGLYFMNITETAVRAFPMVYNNFFGVNVDPKSGLIYTLDAKDFNSNGLLRRYNDDATKIDSFTVGIIPSELYFSK